jgi:5-methylcytosine-specific restriction endonuclease McrA
MNAGDPAKRRARLRIKTQLRRARMRDVEAESVDRDKVGERDGWKCGICRRKVDRSLAYPHPRSASLDHVVPLSQNGPHTYANVRISHLTCNLARSNRGGGEQLALV